ncbi:beta-galactosidase 1-like protein [Carex littledalei]|uniref:Beta-galactosidase n=1 Tax=Carex littledalei TaxID=544730 RepID=A0A833QP55_9POAL|nr:beta-galactosidase 1-like protein [Carex littledalei]
MKAIKSNLLLLLVLISLSCIVQCTDVSHDGRALIINGERRIIISGSIHYPRSTPEMWPDLIKKAKEGGLDTIETYVFWNGHEPRRREYNFEGNYDLIRFIKEIQYAGLNSILRIGPYACAEWNYGGIPAWLRKYPGMQFRTNNQQFKDEMANFTKLIVDMVAKENLLAPQGGPIILLQIENEYGNIMGPYGDAGKEYIKWAAKFAVSLNASVPWIMCQQGDAPQPMINTCNGFYCDDFTPNNPNSPKIWTENWTGWFKAWDKADPHRPAEDVAYAVARFFQRKGTTQNYYMYHGGTNFGRTTGGPYITTSYDYDAPLDEYGNLRQPKWGHLKDLHAVIKEMEKALVYGNHSNEDHGNGIEVTKYKLNTTTACFISNKDTTKDATVDLNGGKYFVPAWSVTILPDCKTEVYNTAKIKAQTNVMVKKANKAEDEPSALQWSWRLEPLKKQLEDKKFSFQSNQLLEQITTTFDESDYLWYMTSFHQPHKKQYKLSINTTGHVLYVFLNNKLVGKHEHLHLLSKERNVTVRHGKNNLALISATVGLKNYGSFYEKMPAGIAGKPVKLIDGNDTIDLSNTTWNYKVGLVSEKKKFHLDEKSSKWKSVMLPINRPFTWYKTTFEAPPGTDPVVIDTFGLGKGEAWVNGNSLGRYWPAYNDTAQGPCGHCDYRGKFTENKPCRTGCGEPAQRWYHIPRSFLKSGETNTLMLFEEAGGSPGLVEFRTVTVGTICATADKGQTLTLSCPSGGSISKIDFASYGEVKGKCGAFEKGTCESQDAFDVVSKACIGQGSCSISVSKETLGENNCGGSVPFKLAIQAAC